MNKLIFHPLFRLLSFATITLFLTSCLDDDINIDKSDPYALVSIYNAVPGSPNMNVFLNGTKVISQPIKYDEFIMPSPIPAGSSTFSFVPANSSDTVVSASYDFKDERIYSIFIVNKTDSTMEALVMEDSLRAVPGNTSLIRVMHFSPDASSLYITMKSEGKDPSTGLYGYKQIAPFVEIPAGKMSFKLKSTTNGEAMDSITDFSIDPLKVYLLFIKGYANPPEGSTDSLSIKLVRT